MKPEVSPKMTAGRSVRRMSGFSWAARIRRQLRCAGPHAALMRSSCYAAPSRTTPPSPMLAYCNFLDWYVSGEAACGFEGERELIRLFLSGVGRGRRRNGLLAALSLVQSNWRSHQLRGLRPVSYSIGGIKLCGPAVARSSLRLLCLGCESNQGIAETLVL